MILPHIHILMHPFKNGIWSIFITFVSKKHGETQIHFDQNTLIQEGFWMHTSLHICKASLFSLWCWSELWKLIQIFAEHEDCFEKSMDLTIGRPKCGESAYLYCFLCKNLEAYMFSHMYMLIKWSSRFLKQNHNCFLLSLLFFLLLNIHSITTESSLDGLVALVHISKAIVGMMNMKTCQMELIAGVYGTPILTAIMSVLKEIALKLLLLLA